MIFEEEKLFFRVLDVFYIRQTDVHLYNRDRHFGALSWRVRSDAVLRCGEKCFTPGDGAVLYMPPDVEYWRTASHDEMFVIQLDVPDYAASEPEILRPEHPETIEKQFGELYRLWSKDEPDRYYAASALTYRLFGELHRICGSREDSVTRFVRAAASYMKERFDDPALSMGQVAAQFGVSEVYLRRVFHAKLGCSPKTFLRDYRLQRAAAMLTSGYDSVKKTARLCGYEDEKYFSVAFRKHTGVSPSRYDNAAVHRF